MAILCDGNNAELEPWSHLRLPPFPQVALRVLQLASNENVPLQELSQLISSDQALSSEILTIVNSLAYTPRIPITSILQAIAVMGANHLQGLCLAVAIRGYIGKSTGHPLLQNLWRHNLACAAIAEQLAAVAFMDHDAVFTFGVMHDIGRMALATVRPKEYFDLLGRHQGTAFSILESEHQLFGKNHCEIGRQLVEVWKLPEDFEPVIAEHHQPEVSDCVCSISTLINIACRMADTAGFPAFPGCQPTPYADLLNLLSQRQRKLFHPEIDTLILEVNRKIRAIESI